MAHMLKVAAGQLRDPVMFLVQMKADDGLFHARFKRIPAWAQIRARRLCAQVSGFISGNSSTSRMEAELVKSMTSRSMPMPSPAVGGMPYSRARI